MHNHKIAAAEAVLFSMGHEVRVTELAQALDLSEEEMGQVAVHEHIGDQLVDMEVVGQKEMQTQDVVQPVVGFVADAHTTHEHREEKHHDVGDEQTLCDYGYFSHV